MTKPAPIHIGVSGFNAFIAEPKPIKEPIGTIDWYYLLDFPPFEMYLSEKTGNEDRMAWESWLLAELANNGDAVVYKNYADWHANKGYWANETPMGRIIHA